MAAQGDTVPLRPLAVGPATWSHRVSLKTHQRVKSSATLMTSLLRWRSHVSYTIFTAPFLIGHLYKPSFFLYNLI